MEDQCSSLSWAYYPQEEAMEELRNSLVYTTLELESTILSAHEEIKKREYELIHLKDLLNKTIKERDEAQAKCQKLQDEKLVLQSQLQLQQQQQKEVPFCGISSSEDESRGGDSKWGFSPSDSDQNVISTPVRNPIHQPQLPRPLQRAIKKPLPEKGKFLQAVMEAGPLLQTLLLAGPLPQWQHPPPQLDSIEIPPVTISPSRTRLLQQDSCISSTRGCFNKRGILSSEDPVSAPNKYPRFHH